MKKLPILKWILIMLLFVVMWFIGLFLVPIAYMLRKSITKNGKKYWHHMGLYWFTDNSENWSTPEKNYINNWWGVYEIYNRDYESFKKLNAWRKFWLNYRWIAIRNPHWNFKRKMAPIEGKKHTVVFKKNTIIPKRHIVRESNIDWLSWQERGVMFGFFMIQDYKFFRYSHIIKVPIFGNYIWMLELGTRHVDQSRYAAKSKFRKRN